MRKLTLREVRTVVAALDAYQAIDTETRADCDHFDALTPLSDDQIDKLRGRISAAKSVNLS